MSLGVSMEYLLDPLPADATLGQKLIHYRWCQGWTQMEMSEFLGVDRDTLLGAERGRDKPYIRSKLAELNIIA